jgi:hypothetical protein
VRIGLQTAASAEVAGNGLAAGTAVVTSQPGGLRDGATIADAGSGPQATPAGLAAR